MVIPAQVPFLLVVRRTTAAAAALCDFDPSRVEAAQAALALVCGALMDCADDDASIHIIYIVVAGRLTVTVRGRGCLPSAGVLRTERAMLLAAAAMRLQAWRTDRVRRCVLTSLEMDDGTRDMTREATQAG